MTTTLPCLVGALVLGASAASGSAGCATDAAPHTSAAQQTVETFDWGGDCSSGSGRFEQAIPFRDALAVGVVPAGKANVRIDLNAAVDVDVQLIVADSGHEIIAWPNGDLTEATPGCTRYDAVEYCYSGYNGNQGPGGLGVEYIEVRGVTNAELIMKAYGYEEGVAEVTYSWQAANTCSETGAGAFAAELAERDASLVGQIPAGKVNVEIRLAAAADLDVQLYDGDAAVVKWPDGLLAGPGLQTLERGGATITWSGYGGDGTGAGNEFIRIDGVVPSTLTMRAFGYEAGTADVTYEWGVGAGLTCGGMIPTPACKAGLVCENVAPNGIARDIPGECHTETWCLNDAMAEENCAGLVHPDASGYWGCEQFQCAWKLGAPPLMCNSTSQCGAGEHCSVDDGDCLSSCPPGAELCPAVCAGFCVADECTMFGGECPDGYMCIPTCDPDPAGPGEPCGINPAGACGRECETAADCAGGSR